MEGDAEASVFPMSGMLIITASPTQGHGSMVLQIAVSGCSTRTASPMGGLYQGSGLLGRAEECGLKGGAGSQNAYERA